MHEYDMARSDAIAHESNDIRSIMWQRFSVRREHPGSDWLKAAALRYMGLDLL